ncbi:MAG: hypothetical protein JWP69_310 [Flaviaesturariibacter sp.]|nr:hypothetical protein [Flaviaesturariibacter sp.]
MKEPAMKILLLLAICAISFTASAQVMNQEMLKKRVEEFNNKYKDGDMPNVPLFKPKFQTNLASASPSLVPRRSGVHSLPQDGMPCIVPDVTEIAAMPNAATKMDVFKSSIPNAVPVQPIFPETPKKEGQR